MMKRKLCLILCLIALMCLCAACSGTAPGASDKAVLLREETAPPAANDSAPGGEDGGVYTTTQDGDLQFQVDPNRKLIRTGELRVESLSFDESLNSLNRLVGSAGGYIESSDVTGVSTGSAGLRSATFAVRVPAEQFDAFLGRGGDLGNVLSRSTSSSDVTDQYFDTEAHLDMLRMELRVLQEEFEKEAPMADRITLLDKMTQVQYEIEKLTGTLRKYDKLVAYASVNVTIYEVLEIRDPEPLTPEPKTLGQRITRQISDSWASLVSGGADFLVWFIGALPFLLLWGALIWLVVFFCRKIGKNIKKRRAAAPKAPTPRQAFKNPPSPVYPPPPPPKNAAPQSPPVPDEPQPPGPENPSPSDHPDAP